MIALEYKAPRQVRAFLLFIYPDGYKWSVVCYLGFNNNYCGLCPAASFSMDGWSSIWVQIQHPCARTKLINTWELCRSSNTSKLDWTETKSSWQVTQIIVSHRCSMTKRDIKQHGTWSAAANAIASFWDLMQLHLKCVAHRRCQRRKINYDVVLAPWSQYIRLQMEVLCSMSSVPKLTPFIITDLQVVNLLRHWSLLQGWISDWPNWTCRSLIVAGCVVLFWLPSWDKFL